MLVVSHFLVPKTMALLAAMRGIGERAEALRQMRAELSQKNELVWEWMRGVHPDSRPRRWG